MSWGPWGEIKSINDGANVTITERLVASIAKFIGNMILGVLLMAAAALLKVAVAFLFAIPVYLFFLLKKERIPFWSILFTISFLFAGIDLLRVAWYWLPGMQLQGTVIKKGYTEPEAFNSYASGFNTLLIKYGEPLYYGEPRPLEILFLGRPLTGDRFTYTHTWTEFLWLGCQILFFLGIYYFIKPYALRLITYFKK